MSQQQLEDCLKVLHNWKQETGKRIIQVLQRIFKTQTFKESELQHILDCVNTYHKQIIRADESLVVGQWFDLCIKIKKRLNRELEDAEKMRKKNSANQKKQNSSFIVEYPTELTAGKGPNDEKLLKFLFKNFVTNFQEAMRHPKTGQFIISTLKEIKRLFEDKVDNSLNKRIMSIANRLARESSRQSKEKMLRGEILPRELANDDEQLYFDQKMKDNIKKLQMEELERSRTGFYEEMKKKINKDASEECRFCYKKAAYCEDQKQIRASDQPMTRFMRCNACDKAWRD